MVLAVGCFGCFSEVLAVGCVGCFSEEVDLRLPFPVVLRSWPFIDTSFFSGALYTKGADVGIVGVMTDFIVELAFAWL